MALPMETPPVPATEDHRVDYPVILNVAGRRCLVVGGGPVAARKVRGLLDAGAEVTVIAPRISEALRTVEDEATGGRPVPSGSPGPAGDGAGSPVARGSLDIRKRQYRRGEAADYHLVATATGVPTVDAAVVSDAESAGVLVNSADPGTPGTISLPAVHRQGGVTVAVSTRGASPALARWLRDRIAASLPPGTATLVVLADEARTAVRDAGRPTGTVAWAVLLDRAALLVEAGRIDEARALLSGLGDDAGPSEAPSIG